MSEVGTQVRAYFDAVVERVDVEDVLAQLDVDVVEPQRPRGRRPLLRRSWVAAAVVVLVLVSAVGVVAVVLGLGGGRAFNAVRGVAVGPDGGVWAVTAGGVVQWDAATGVPTVFDESDGLPATDAGRIDVDEDGTVWVAAEGWVASYTDTWTSYTEFGAVDVVSIKDVAAGTSGSAWFWADMDPAAGLLRHDAGTWSAVAAPDDWLVVDELWGGHAFSIDIGPDGTIWVGSDNGVLAYDGDSWTHHTAATSGLASDVAMWVAAAQDGTIWIGTEPFAGDEVRDAISAAGVVAFDGTTWTTYTTDDGLGANDAKVVVGPGGTVWALHADAVSRFNGDKWTSFAVEGETFGATVGADGSLWRPTLSGIERFDGTTTVVTLIVPADAAPVEVVAIALEPIGEPTTTATPLGDITWYRFAEPTGHWLRDIEVTPYGLVAIDGWALRWSEDLATWSGALVSFDPWKLTLDQDELIVHGAAAARAEWDGSRWIEAGPLGIELTGDQISQVAVGDRVTVLTVRSRVFYSSNGDEFVPAAHAPDPTQLLAEWTDQEHTIGCWATSFGSWPGEGSIGPVLVTGDGFIALTPRHPANWNNDPLCEPVLWYSPDGRSWELVSDETPFGSNAAIYDVASHAGRHVAVGTTGSKPAIWVSDDALDWTVVDPPQGWALPTAYDRWPTAVAGGDLGWVLLEDCRPPVCAGPGGAGWVSVDGSVWTPIPEEMPGTPTFWSPQDLSVGHGMIAVSGTEELVFGVLED